MGAAVPKTTLSTVLLDTIYTVEYITKCELTLDFEVDPLGHSGGHVVAGDTEVGAHVLSPHLGTEVQRERCTGTNVQRYRDNTQVQR